MPETPPITLPPISGPSREECDYLLGAYIGRWGNVEVAIAELIRKLLDTDMTTSRIILRALGDMRVHHEIAAELGKHRLNNSDYGNLQKLLDRVKTAATRRNRIIHGTWIMHIEMGDPPNPRPLIAKSARWYRRYEPSQQDEFDKLMTGKIPEINAAYNFWPEDLKRDVERAGILAREINSFARSVTLKAPRIPLPIEW